MLLVTPTFIAHLTWDKGTLLPLSPKLALDSTRLKEPFGVRFVLVLTDLVFLSHIILISWSCCKHILCDFGVLETLEFQDGLRLLGSLQICGRPQEVCITRSLRKFEKRLPWPWWPACGGLGLEKTRPFVGSLTRSRTPLWWLSNLGLYCVFFCVVVKRFKFVGWFILSIRVDFV